MLNAIMKISNLAKILIQYIALYFIRKLLHYFHRNAVHQNIFNFVTLNFIFLLKSLLKINEIYHGIAVNFLANKLQLFEEMLDFDEFIFQFEKNGTMSNMFNSFFDAFTSRKLAFETSLVLKKIFLDFCLAVASKKFKFDERVNQELILILTDQDLLNLLNIKKSDYSLLLCNLSHNIQSDWQRLKTLKHSLELSIQIALADGKSFKPSEYIDACKSLPITHFSLFLCSFIDFVIINDSKRTAVENSELNKTLNWLILKNDNDLTLQILYLLINNLANENVFVINPKFFNTFNHFFFIG